MALEKSAYRNLLDYIIIKENRTCRGCIHAIPFVMLGKSIEACAKGRKFGTKCKLYKEAE
jgi:hypothetical protein